MLWRIERIASSSSFLDGTPVVRGDSVTHHVRFVCSGDINLQILRLV
jgi:hypothetical protein